MTIIADFLVNSRDVSYKLYPNSEGEIVISPEFVEDQSDIWTATTYTIPTESTITYQTLADSAGKTWYLYISGDGEAVLTTTAPSDVAGAWSNCRYQNKITPTEATIGNEIYLALADSDSTSWYVYPNASGELIVTTTAPV